MEFADDRGRLAFPNQHTEWTPAPAEWETIKQRSRGKTAKVTVLGFQHDAPTHILSHGQVCISTSEDEVGAPLFYRGVNLPFAEAVKDPSRIRWRFGAVSSTNPPPVVLEHLPVCGNCHSFSRDGKVLGMDVDYANNKGSYVITRVAKEMVLASSEIMTWDDYKREDGQQTLGLLQPDSVLYIIPAEGGEARRLKCNTSRMNSWHSWSPNSRWLVFSSKANSSYTQLFLTHIDEQGESSVPVVLAHFTAPDRAANIPKFVNAPADAIGKINEQFLNDYSHVRAAFFSELSGDVDYAISEYQKALALNPNSMHAHQRLGYLFYNVKHKPEEGLAHTTEALRFDPLNGFAHYDLGMAMRGEGKLDLAAEHFAAAVRLTPTSTLYHS